MLLYATLEGKKTIKVIHTHDLCCSLWSFWETSNSASATFFLPDSPTGSRGSKERPVLDSIWLRGDEDWETGRSWHWRDRVKDKTEMKRARPGEFLLSIIHPISRIKAKSNEKNILTLIWDKRGGLTGGSSYGLSAKEAMIRFLWPSREIFNTCKVNGAVVNPELKTSDLSCNTCVHWLYGGWWTTRELCKEKLKDNLPTYNLYYCTFT